MSVGIQFKYLEIKKNIIYLAIKDYLKIFRPKITLKTLIINTEVTPFLTPIIIKMLKY